MNQPYLCFLPGEYCPKSSDASTPVIADPGLRDFLGQR